MKYDLREQSKHSLDITLLSIQVEQAVFDLNSDDGNNVTSPKQQARNKGAAISRLRIYVPKGDPLFFRKRK